MTTAQELEDEVANMNEDEVFARIENEMGDDDDEVSLDELKALSEEKLPEEEGEEIAKEDGQAKEETKTETDPATTEGQTTEEAAVPPEQTTEAKQEQDDDLTRERLIIPQITAKPVENYDQNLEALREQRRQVRTMVRNGELEEDAADQHLERIDDQISNLKDTQRQYEFAIQQQAAAEAQAWQVEIQTFMRTSKRIDGIDYAADPKLNKALDTFVKVLAADDENSGKSAEWFLEEAHQYVKTKFGLNKPAVTKEEQEPVKEPVKETKPAQTRMPDLKKVPPSLAKVPVAATGTADDGEFAHLENLSGVELEKAVAKMSPTQWHRYMES